MDFPVKRTKVGYNNEPTDLYLLSDPDLYNSLPSDEITLDEFIALGVRRRKLLSNMRQVKGYSVKEHFKFTKEEDINSQYILRLANCDSHARLSYADNERALYKQRLTLSLHTLFNQKGEHKHMNIPHTDISVPADISSYLQLLDMGMRGATNVSLRKHILRVKFDINMSSILRDDKLRVVLRDGYIYMWDIDWVDYKAEEVRRKLIDSLISLEVEVNKMKTQDPTVYTLISSLQDEQPTYTSSTVTGSLHLDNLQEYMHQSFPLCMSRMYEVGKSNGHLRHEARVQLGLFIKNAGMTPETTLEFWRRLFSTKFTPKDFDKQYLQSFEHLVGLKGSKKQLNGHGCIKMITTTDAKLPHGCPFRGMDKKDLKTKIYQRFSTLQLENVDNAVNDVVDLATKGHFQLACKAYFTATHGGLENVHIRSPNEYFDKSREYYTRIKQQNEDNASGNKKPVKTQ